MVCETMVVAAQPGPAIAITIDVESVHKEPATGRRATGWLCGEGEIF